MAIEKEKRAETSLEFSAVLLMAGQGRRFGSDKLNRKVKGKPLWYYSLKTFSNVESISRIVLVVRNEVQDIVKHQISGLQNIERISVIAGGEKRGDSVWNALVALEQFSPQWVLIHDCARPLVKTLLIERVMNHLRDGCSSVVPGVELRDTIKSVRIEGDLRLVDRTLDRASLMAIQTPQGFDFELIYKAYGLAKEKGLYFTDDAGYVEWLGEEVFICKGERDNIKLTYPEDWFWVEEGLTK